VLRVVLGHYLGFIGIMAVAVAGALGAGLLPESVLPYLGLSPLALGLRAAWRLWPERHDQDHDGMTEPVGPGALSVAAVTFANGGGQHRRLRTGVHANPVQADSLPASSCSWSLSPSGARQNACSPPGR
jgi:hypothetical protein